MKNTEPLVSIITPVYNGSRYIEELILSVIEQDYSFIEHIVIDDGSTDNGKTVEILKKYKHLRWWSHHNKGAYATINEGLIASKGELVTIICSDDFYASKTSISELVKLWCLNKDIDVVYGDTIRVDEKNNILDDEPPRCVPLWLFRYYPGIAHCSLLIKRSIVINQDFLFDIRLLYTADYDWIIRLIKNGYKFKKSRKPIASFRVHSNQRSQDDNMYKNNEHNIIRHLHGDINPVLMYIVDKWWRITKLKNLFLRRGFMYCVQRIYKKIKINK